MESIRLPVVVPPFFAMLTIVAVLSTLTAGASFMSFPLLGDKFLFNMGTLDTGPSYQTVSPNTIKKVEKIGMPFSDLSAGSGIDMPFDNFNPFYSPYKSHRSYQRTIYSPDGPKTKAIDVVYDGTTGEKITTVTTV